LTSKKSSYLLSD